MVTLLISCSQVV